MTAAAPAVKPPRVWARPTSTPGKLCDCGPCLPAWSPAPRRARKSMLIVEAEKLLAMLVNKGAKLDALAPCRNYAGLIGGQAAPRSGAADALLLAWLAYRKWRGVTDGAPLLCIDPAWTPEPGPPRARARKLPVPENLS